MDKPSGYTKAVLDRDRRRKCSACGLPMATSGSRAYRWCVNSACKLAWLKVWGQ